MKKIILSTAVLLSVSGYALTANADTKAEEFVQKAAISGKFEIDSSKLAVERTKDAEVKAFAEKMIADHTKADADLKGALEKAKIAPTVAPKQLDEIHQKMFDELKESSAKDFDEDYIDAQEDAHEEAVALFEDYSKNGDNEVLREFATKTLPTLKSHHEKVEALDETVDDKDDHADHKTKDGHK